MNVIAHSASDLNREFFARVFATEVDVLEGVEVEPVGTGQIASTYRVRLEWTERLPHCPIHVVVKVAGDEVDGREPERRIATFRREVGFYNQLGSKGSLPIPSCFHADADDQGDFTLVMSESPGRSGDQIIGCTERVARAFVDAAAIIHSQTWGLEMNVRDLPWLATGAKHEAEIALRNERYSKLLTGFIDRYRQRLDESCLVVAERLAGNLEVIDRQLRLRTCIVHNDYRLDNMIIDETAVEPRVIVIDWQTVGVGSGAVDVAYAIGSGLTSEDRRRHEYALIDRYVERLHDTGIDADPSDILHDYRLGSASGLVMAVIASQVVRRTERGDEMFAVMAERHALQIIDLGLFDLLEHNPQMEENGDSRIR